MAIGDKLDEKGGFCLIHRPGMLFSFWSQTAVMRFMELFTHSVFFFFHIVMFIFLFKSKILFFRATGVQCENLRGIVSYCL